MNEKETKPGSRKALWIIEIVLIILGLLCSIYSMINEINRIDQNPQALEASEEGSEINTEDANNTAAPQNGASVMNVGDPMAPAMAAGNQMPPAVQQPAAPADTVATASDAGDETEGTEQTDAEATGEDQLQPPADQPMANMPAFMDQMGGIVSKFITMIMPIIMYILAALYLFVSYKKPHGNALRYTMFVFALYLSVIGILSSGFKCEYLLPVSAVFVAYIAGRLNKFNKNLILMSIVGALLLAFSIVEITNMVGGSIIGIYSTLGFLVIWIVLCDAYVTRYNEHKQAGIDQDIIEASEKTAEEAVEEPAE